MHSIVWFFTTGIYDAAWVQAVAAIVLVILTFVTLIVLSIYAWDTHTLAKTSKVSAEAAERSSKAASGQMQFMIRKERPQLSIEIKDFVLGEIPVVNYELRCHGTTPAYVQSSWEMTSLAPIPDFIWLKSAYGTPLRDLPEVVPTGTIKGFVFIMGTDDCGYSTEVSQKESLDKGGLYLHFRVRIVFKDIFDDEREHEYLFSKVYGLNRGKSESGSVGEMLGLPLYPGWADSIHEYGQDE
jgi:hypothetical protein